MTDDEAEAVALAALTLAVTVRDEGPAAVRDQAAAVLAAAGGDAIAALTVLAALIDVDRPADRWWQDPSPRLSFAADVDEPHHQRHGTHAGHNYHRDHGEKPCAACLEGERAYQRGRQASRTEAARARRTESAA